MDLKAEKLRLIEAIRHIDDETLLGKIKELIAKEYSIDNEDFQTLNEPEAGYLNAFWANLTPEQRAELEADIEEGERDIEAGNVFPHEEVWKEFEKWETKKK